MNTQEEELLTALRAEFAVEAVEHLHAMTSGLLELEKTPPPERVAVIVETICRQAHSLKGEARAVNYPDLEAICQAVETVFAAWKNGSAAPQPHVFDVLHGALDAVRAMLATEGAMTRSQRDAMMARLSSLCQGGQRGKQDRIVPASPGGERIGAPAETLKSGAEESVRMPLNRLEELLLGLEELLAVKLALIRRHDAIRASAAMAEQTKRDLLRLNAELLSGSASSEGVSPLMNELLDRSRLAVSDLDKALASLARDAEKDAHWVSLLVDDLLGQSKRLLMLPFNTLLGILPKLARDLGRDLGKDVEVVIRGGDIEIDKRILQELKDATIHLIRNCVDHGIEPVAARAKKGKPDRGTITVEVLPVDAGKVELVIGDDGAGIDAEAVKKAAVRAGVISAKDAGRLSQEAAIALIFRSSVSTNPLVSAVSGRGLGMAIAREIVEKLGGQVEVQSRTDKGTTFRITLPLTLATFRGTLVGASGRWFVLPSASVQRVARFRRDQIKTLENRDVLSWEGHTLSFAWLADVLGVPPADMSAPSTPLVSFAVVGVGDKRIALGVEEILTEQEVLVKSFMKPLSRIRNVSGATVLATGQVVPILNVSDLLKSCLLAGMVPVTVPKEDDTGPAPGQPKTVLVVEDSIVSRMLFKGILESAGYGVTTAVDGEEAWEVMQRQDFDAVVSDVEMPRLNGFELTERIRHDPRFGEKPVILVTGLSSQEDRARGIEVGASAYVVKSNFDQGDLLETLRRVV